ncbi:FMN-binding negative transcriptional regulator [Methylovulum psychrotolerans]|uniref:Transcriptional regulator n=1 Tax=Methylovulum psychrotolerans TaxID=1704499 RepID=A0A1Z4BXY6_9GAMM|nr:FMN-binding negative transcriptional regulator [Methylovulum psychrotolerans]ASF46156.1 transcriptional regulator [Methylovulum psychrotolerans]
MYQPTQFVQPSIAVMHELMRQRPLATLVTLASDGLNANLIPLHLSDAPTPFGTLRGHVARANPLWTDINPAVEVLAVFHGPDAYISPSWYATKQDTGRVVPTWNYTVVQAYGHLQVIDDAQWLRAQLAALTDHNEAGFAEPWAVADAPPEFTEQLLAAIVGIELVITRLSGKWKVSQNQPAVNQASVMAGLQGTGQMAMADLVAAGGKGAD